MGFFKLLLFFFKKFLLNIFQFFWHSPSWFFCFTIVKIFPILIFHFFPICIILSFFYIFKTIWFIPLTFLILWKVNKIKRKLIRFYWNNKLIHFKLSLLSIKTFILLNLNLIYSFFCFNIYFYLILKRYIIYRISRFLNLY